MDQFDAHEEAVRQLHLSDEEMYEIPLQQRTEIRWIPFAGTTLGELPLTNLAPFGIGGTDHETVPVTLPDGHQIEVDEGIANLVRELNNSGVHTLSSCENIILERELSGSMASITARMEDAERLMGLLPPWVYTVEMGSPYLVHLVAMPDLQVVVLLPTEDAERWAQWLAGGEQ